MAITEQDATKARKAIKDLEAISGIVTWALLAIGAGGLVFTCVNVTLFAVDHEVSRWIAWLLDPLVSLALITVLYVDGRLSDQGDYKPRGWPFVLRWFAGMATWLMNSWVSLYPDGLFTLIPEHADAGGLLLHSVIPFLVIILAEASAGYRKYVSGKLAAHNATIHGYQDALRQEEIDAAERAREEAREAQRRADEEAQNEAAREEARALREAENEAAREAREHEARLAREARDAQIEAARIQSDAEIERVREEARLTQIEAERTQREAKIEAERIELEARLEQDAKDREAKRQTDLILAEAQAKQAEADLHEKRAAEAVANLRASQAASQSVSESATAPRRDTSRSASISAIRPSRSASKSVSESARGTSKSASEGASQSERLSREQREAQRENAELEVAALLLSNQTPNTADLANRYGKGETWVGDRIRAARRRLAEEAGFEDTVILHGLELNIA